MLFIKSKIHKSFLISQKYTPGFQTLLSAYISFQTLLILGFRVSESFQWIRFAKPHTFTPLSIVKTIYESVFLLQRKALIDNFICLTSVK